MAGILTSVTRVIPETALELEMVFAPNPENITHCDVCNALWNGPSLITFVNAVPQSAICLTCAFDVADLIRGCPDEQIRLASSINRNQGKKPITALERLHIASRTQERN
jgi:hypothetical protein